MYFCGTLLTIYISNLYILHDIINDPSISNLDTSMASTEMSDSDTSTSETQDISAEVDIYSESNCDFDDEIKEFVKEVAQEYKEKNANEREAELRADKADEREYNED
jgi:hypothetical protein